MRYKDLHVLEFWPRFKNIEIGASIDGMKEQGEFIRSGFSWQQFIDNREKMKETCPHANFYVNCTISIQNSYHIVPFHLMLVELGLIDDYDAFNVNIVTDPPHLDVRILPENHKEALSKLYDLHIDYMSKNSKWVAKQGFESLKNHLLTKDRVLEDNRKGYLARFEYKMRQLDDIRNEDFQKTFPELEDLYNAIYRKR